MTAERLPLNIYSAMRREGADLLRKANVESADADARILLCHVAKMDAAALILREGEVARHDETVAYFSLIERRSAGEPVARIVGEKEFWSLRFALGGDTLVPRPETETIVEAALAEIGDKKRELSILDLGTGTGAILAALLSELPNASGVAVDCREAALRVARENLRNLSLGARVSYLCGDWANAIRGTFDLVVSNPPYIASGEVALLSPEVREHDPRLALDGGPDGLAAYRIIVNQLCELLAEDGKAVLELGRGQEAAVSQLVCETAKLSVAGKARKDLAGIPRALVIHAKR
jgi:release factor glutamine methyltransferase